MAVTADDMTPMSDEELREWATALIDAHTPAKQEGNPYERCALCHYTHHPCDVWDLAAWVVTLLDRMAP